MNNSEAIAAVAAERGLGPHCYTAHQAPARIDARRPLVRQRVRSRRNAH